MRRWVKSPQSRDNLARGSNRRVLQESGARLEYIITRKLLYTSTATINDVDADGYRNVDFSEVLMARKTKNANTEANLVETFSMLSQKRDDLRFKGEKGVEAEFPFPHQEPFF